MQLRLSTTTDVPPQEVIEQALDFFLKYGLRVLQKGPNNVALAGGGGTVAIQAGYQSSQSDVTEVDLFTTEWHHPARKFMAEISGKQPQEAAPQTLFAGPMASVLLVLASIGLVTFGLFAL